MKTITLKAVRPTEEIMQDLERRGLITRLLPSRKEHRVEVLPGEGLGVAEYVSRDETGTHSLVRCAIAFDSFKAFGAHNGNEEFLLLGGVDERALLLLISYDNFAEFCRKLHSGALTAADFICLSCVFNDPRLSFFVMHEGVPHGECACGEGLPATFYVTEGSKLSGDSLNLADYINLQIQKSD